ncbi:MAG: branched-chain amino acid ABC transporter permease [Firmicutes bacterium]|nr:branched-chain amino acid ABC transporter permease [Bacillota bacterium]MCL5039904.1 branched-chain amino acid ABC transporter permease [Bacillota bacterium]
MSLYYYLVVGITLGLYSLLSLSLNIITGYAGQPTLGHAAFFGIGAYTSALLTTRAGLNFWLALPLSFLTAALVGWVVGLASLRVKEDFLAITTMGINFVVVSFFLYSPYFGGALGLGNIPAPALFGFNFDKTAYFGLVAVVTITVVLFSRFLEKTWMGLAFRALRDDEEAALANGIKVQAFKLWAFVLGTGLAGLAGSLYAHHITFISAGDFGFPLSITVLAMAVFGGLGTVEGALAGALILGLAPEVFRFLADYRMLVYGGLLVVMMLFKPSGLLGRTELKINLFRRLPARRRG